MDIKGKILVFVKEIGKDKIKIFETTISRKNEEGDYIDNYSIRVQFPASVMPDKAKAKFKTDKAYYMNVEGFLSTRGYEDSEGDYHIYPLIVAQKATLALDENGKPIIKEVKRKEAKKAAKKEAAKADAKTEEAKATEETASEAEPLEGASFDDLTF